MKHLTDHHLEEDVISYILEYPLRFKDVSKLIDEECFTHSFNKEVFLGSVELSQSSLTFTRADLFRWLKSKNKKSDYNKVLTLRPSRIIDLDEVCLELLELNAKRKTFELSGTIDEMLLAGADSDSIKSIIQSYSESDKGSIINKSVVTINEVYDETISNLVLNAGKTKFSGVDTGSRKLNFSLGGWQAGLILVAARPSMGKTIVGLDIAKHSALSGVPVLFVSLEMPAQQLMYRTISSESDDNVPYGAIASYRVTQEQVKGFSSVGRKINDLPYFFYDGDNRDVNYIINIITAQVRKSNIGLVVIDYVQLLRDVLIRDQSDYAQITSISSKLQQCAKRLKIPVIALSQLSRELEKRSNKRPQLSDLRNSGQLEQDAHVVIGLFRPFYYAQQEARDKGEKDPEKDNTLEFIILKQRNGFTGNVIRYCDVATNRIADDEESLFRFTSADVIESSINKIESDFLNKQDIAPF